MIVCFQQNLTSDHADSFNKQKQYYSSEKNSNVKWSNSKSSTLFELDCM